MFNMNIQLQILSHLEYRDLLSVGQVNRWLNRASSHPDLWKREVLKMFSSENMHVSTSNNCSDWKSIFLQGLSLLETWKRSSDPILTVPESLLLYSETNSILINPEAVLPFPRREQSCFPTLIQDLMSHSTDYLTDSKFEIASAFRTVLQENIELIWSEIVFYSENTATLPESTNSFALKTLHSLKSTITYYCKLTGLLIASIENNMDMLEEYLNKWELFSYSIVHISNLFLPYSDMMNLMFGMKVSIPEMMRDIWTAEVFRTYKPQLLEAFARILMLERQEVVLTGSFSYNHLGVLQGFTQSIWDLSLDECTVYFKNHTNLKLAGPILDLHGMIVQIYQHDFTLNSSSESDLKLLESLGLPATSFIILKSKLSTFEECLQSKNYTIYHQESSLKDEELQQAITNLNSAYYWHKNVKNPYIEKLGKSLKLSLEPIHI